MSNVGIVEVVVGTRDLLHETDTNSDPPDELFHLNPPLGLGS